MIALALQAIATFNLACAGIVGDSGGREEQETVILRIDLEHRQWCVDNCLTVNGIARLSDTEIVLIDETDEHGTIRWFVNRRTGAFQNSIRNRRDGNIFWRRGTCERRPFSGFEGPSTMEIIQRR